MAVVERAKLQDEMISELQSYVCSCATMVMFWRGEGECIRYLFEFLVLELFLFAFIWGFGIHSQAKTSFWWIDVHFINVFWRYVLASDFRNTIPG